ncbi:hypothetical protein LTR16_009345, partial [Cryomyces antarcticus]
CLMHRHHTIRSTPPLSAPTRNTANPHILDLTEKLRSSSSTTLLSRRPEGRLAHQAQRRDPDPIPSKLHVRQQSCPPASKGKRSPTETEMAGSASEWCTSGRTRWVCKPQWALFLGAFG